MKPPTQRQRRVNEEIRNVVSETLHRGHFSDEVLFEHARDVTVGEVSVSPDLKNAKIYVMSLGGKDLQNILTALNASARYFQAEINHKLNLKFTPRITFAEDTSFAEAQRIETLLKNIQ